MAECIARVVAENSNVSWERLLTFAYQNLHIPHIKSNRSLTSIIKSNVTHPSFPIPHPANNPTDQTPRVSSTTLKYKCKSIENKLSDGNLKGATRLLFSSDTLATYSPAVLNALQEKHPCASMPSPQPNSPAATSQPLQVSKTAILHAILSFPAGSAGGLDGISPQHLKDLTSPLAGDAGCQQGDPLGPAIFSLAIHPVISQLTSELNFWYLDDGTIGGSKSSVLADLKTLIDRFAEIGLSINFKKCEMFISEAIPPNTRSTLINEINQLTPNISILSRETLTLLGAPILDESIPLSINSKIDQFYKCSNLFYEISPHMALYILRLCLFSPKFLYILRCAPLWKFPIMTAKIDQILRDTVGKILNVTFTSPSWTQATLPIKYGGLGIRLTGSLALPAFLSSAYSTITLIGGILRIPSTANVSVSCLADAESAWRADHPVEQIPEEKASQAAWDAISIKMHHQLLLQNCHNDHERARLLAVSEKESGHWLHALPSRNLGSTLEPPALRIAVCLRLGLKVCEPHACSRCAQPVDALGRHGLHCQMSAGRLYRHATLNDLIRRALCTASLPATLEPSGLSATDGKRPDGCTLVPWSLGRPLAWDATCVDTLAPSHVEGSARKPGTAADQAQTLKRRKYAFLTDQYEFAALAIETLGPWSSDTKQFMKEVSVRLIGVSGDHRAGSFFAQRLSLAVQRGNAASILGSIPEAGSFGEVFYI
ncbi:uncharacterized protein LOC133519817 isoform X2 [Cydia pomonella]|uniref:uncharacterized protein LOC133519817 isoform X2 n=1 Tax=Cydia pomonella TaxID=82600 RepID=UPI002ADDBE75|nr:uncharacterized protein LOC133519817 isoform X2 [Cydia pomonella]